MNCGMEKASQKLDSSLGNDNPQEILWKYFSETIMKVLVVDKSNLVENYLVGICVLIESLKSIYGGFPAVMTTLLINLSLVEGRYAKPLTDNLEISRLLLSRSQDCRFLELFKTKIAIVSTAVAESI